MEYSKCKILLVEDDPDDAEMTLYALRKLSGVKITHIDDGVDAMAYLFDDINPKPDLILLDIKMPKIDGLQILKQLKADAFRKTIPVVVLISSPEGRKYVESFSVRPDSYLLKPVNCTSFLQAVVEAGISNTQPILNQRG